MKVLIPTETEDSHAKVVARALCERGHDVHLWYASDLPTRQSLSLRLGGRAGAEARIVGVDIDAADPFDVVWLRRATRPVLPDTMHPGDREFAEEEWTRFLRGALAGLAPDAFWVNPWPSAIRAESKSTQIVEAQRVGLTVPETLCSNDPDAIRRFLRENERGSIYKPFCTSQWHHEGGTAFLFTSAVDEDDLPPDDVLRLSPGIFQPLVPKKHELRVTMFGAHAVTVRLDSQSQAATQVDWRAGSWDVDASVGRLPSTVEAKCRALMERLGLVFGCIDFIVTPDDDLVFLEINQMGQFLWLEEMLPELPMLDGFCSLLEARRADFEWSPARATRRFADFFDAATEAELDSRHAESPVPQRFADAAPPTA